jgi:hypothetical protein
MLNPPHAQGTIPDLVNKPSGPLGNPGIVRVQHFRGRDKDLAALHMDEDQF